MSEADNSVVIGAPEIAAHRLGAARKATRYAINHLFISPRGEAVATDGLVLLIGPARRGGAEGAEGMISGDVLRAIEPHVQAKKEIYTTTTPPVATGHLGDGKIEMKMPSDQGHEIRLSAPLEEGKFPGYGEVIPKGEPTVTFCLDARRLRRIAEFMETCMEAQEPELRRVTVEIRDEKTPVVFRAADRGGMALLKPQKLRK